MKIKRQKKVNRYLHFYKNNFGFYEPYQLLLDGTFCQSALQAKVQISEQIPRFLNGEVKLLTTFCVLNEMETIGQPLRGAILIIKQFAVHKCGHEKRPVSAARCFEDMIGDGNSNHYLVATQDKKLREKLRRISGTPLIYLHNSILMFEKPSEISEGFVQSQNESKTEPADYQLSILKKMKEKLPEPAPVKRRRRKPQGPNPLSCKKKQKKPIAKKQGTKKTRKRFRVRIAKHIKDQVAATHGPAQGSQDENS